MTDHLERAKADRHARENGALWTEDTDALFDELIAEVARLRSENERLVKMFSDNTYIESAHMEPGFYDINLRGQGAMLLIGHLIQMFRDTGGENFVTNTLQMTLPDGKTNELFELTIQKVNGKDSPAMKITRLMEEIAAKDARIKELSDLNESLVENGNDLRTRCQKAETRIKELEAALNKIVSVEAAISAERYVQRLEAAFLDSLAARLYYEHYPGVSDAYSWHDYPEEACHSMPKEEFRKKAREALERIREGKG